MRIPGSREAVGSEGAEQILITESLCPEATPYPLFPFLLLRPYATCSSWVPLASQNAGQGFFRPA